MHNYSLADYTIQQHLSASVVVILSFMGAAVASPLLVVSDEVKIREALERVEKAQKTVKEAEEKLKYAQNDEEKETAKKLKSDSLRDVDSEKALVHQLKLQTAVKSGVLVEIETALATFSEEHASGCSQLVNEVS